MKMMYRTAQEDYTVSTTINTSKIKEGGQELSFKYDLIDKSVPELITQPGTLLFFIYGMKLNFHLINKNYG